MKTPILTLATVLPFTALMIHSGADALSAVNILWVVGGPIVTMWIVMVSTDNSN